MNLTLSINFSRPWYLLILIAYALFIIVPYFKLNKRYRKTRNRLTSMALHSIVCLLATFILAGITFVNTISNPNNEIILLVDVSNTENQVKNSRDSLVETIIDQSKFDDFKVGIVTFGYDQEYAVPLTRDYKNIYDNYLNANLPDTSATNVASALLYAKDLFTKGDNGKIVLITDGKETDDNAKSVIRSIAATGLTVDTCYVGSSYENVDDIQIISIELPEYHVNKNEECTIKVTLNSNYQEGVEVTLYDNDVTNSNLYEAITIEPGVTTVELKHTFTTDGLHSIKATATGFTDGVVENNEYTTYYNVETFNKVLIIESQAGQSVLLQGLMIQENNYDVRVLNINEETLPTKVEELCLYDEIIMNNISNADLEDGFDQLLYDYVYTYGGGLFTTGGSDVNGAHAYNRTDMIGTLYQQILPVQAINYTPPVGVICIIDRSGSMSSTDASGSSLLEWAKAGAVSCLNALTDRDYFGIMSLESDYNTILELTPRTQEAKILSAINSMDTAQGGTIFAGAIERAGQALRALKQVDKKHIIIVSDGYVNGSEDQITEYETLAKNYYDNDGITISVVGIDMEKPYNFNQLSDENYPLENIGTTSAFEKMLRLTKIAHGRLHPVSSDNRSQLVTEMREDLNAPDIKETNFESFYPQIKSITSSLFNGVEQLNDSEHSNTLTTVLDGFYGVKVRANADLLLVGDYNVPIYAQWKYGKGMVGSFMCDVYGEFSNEFMNDDNGKILLFNIINNLTPTENIRFNDIKLMLYEDNYSNTLSIFTDLKDGEYLKGRVEYTTTNGDGVIDLNVENTETGKLQLRAKDGYVLTTMNADNKYSRAKFILKTPGTYNIIIEKYDESNTLLGTNSIKKSLAYSEEYDITVDTLEIDYQSNLEQLAVAGNGTSVEDNEDPYEIFASFKTTLSRVYDPRYLFAVIAIVCFLADIAVRKFKFKWPHEIIRNLKEGKK